MAASTAAEEMERLELSDEDTEELWNSPSQRRTKPVSNNSANASTEKNQPRDGERVYDHQEARELALRNELQRVRSVNLAIEGVLESLERAKGNMQTVIRTVDSASTLLNTWTRILSETEHNQRLLLNPNWHGTSNDIAEIESEAAAKQQAAERRERELEERREAARKAEEEKKRVESATATGRGRGTTRGRVVTRGGLGRTTSVSSKGTAGVRSTSSTSTSTSTSARRPVSGIARGSSTSASRMRGKP